MHCPSDIRPVQNIQVPVTPKIRETLVMDDFNTKKG